MPTQEQILKDELSNRSLEVQFTKMLKGKTVKSCRYMRYEEAQQFGWTDRPLVIFFTDGSFIYASRDDEGNDGGAMFTSSSEHPCLPVVRSYF